MDIFVIILLTAGVSKSQYVQMYAPRFAAMNQSILLNCSTVKPPIGDYAEFLVNGKTYTSLQIYKFQCVVGNENIDCERDNCQCSYNSLWYSLRYTSHTNDKRINFKCIMKYSDVGKQSDEISTTFFDIKRPTVSSNKRFPLLAGVEAEIKCSVPVIGVQVEIVWDCKNLSKVHHKYNSTTEFISTFTFIPSSVLNGITCTCVVEKDDFVSIANITLEVTNSPFLKLDKKIICNSTKSTVISCEVSGELSTYGFFQWIHSLNGHIIRKLEGTVVNNSSYLVLKSCGYQDAGTYLCRAWNDYRGQIFLANRTIKVEVLGKPVIIKTYIKKELDILFAVSFLSNPKVFNVQWYLLNEPISNATNHAVDETKLYILMFEKRLSLEGFVTNFTLLKPITGIYTVIIENEYGKTKGKLELTTKGSTYKLSDILLILTGVGVFIVTMTLSTLFTRRHSIKFSTDNIIAIYHAAPAIDNQMGVYDIPGNQYEECEDIEATSDYLEVVSSSCSENGDQYEEVQ